MSATNISEETQLTNVVKSFKLPSEKFPVAKNGAKAVPMGTLAIAYASAGRFSDAVNTAQKAIQLADTLDQPQIRNIIQQQLSLYQQGKPYIESSRKSFKSSDAICNESV